MLFFDANWLFAVIFFILQGENKEGVEEGMEEEEVVVRPMVKAKRMKAVVKQYAVNSLKYHVVLSGDAERAEKDVDIPNGKSVI